MVVADHGRLFKDLIYTLGDLGRIQGKETEFPRWKILVCCQ